MVTILSIFLTVDQDKVMVVESNAKNFQLRGVDVWCVNADVGFWELATDIHDGVL